MDRHRPRSPLGPDPPGVGGTGPSAVPPSPDMRARPGLPSTHPPQYREFLICICSNIESAGARRGEGQQKIRTGRPHHGTHGRF